MESILNLYNISKSKFSFQTILLVLVGMYPELGLMIEGI
jgi:hypothetical protein